MAYSVWLEFEQYVNPPLEEPDGYCNIAVIHDDGTRQGYMVWTIDLFRENIQSILTEAVESGFAVMPDFIVSRITREHIETVLKQVLPTNVVMANLSE